MFRAGRAVGLSHAPHVVEVLTLFSMCKLSPSKAFRRTCTDWVTLRARAGRRRASLRGRGRSSHEVRPLPRGRDRGGHEVRPLPQGRGGAGQRERGVTELRSTESLIGSSEEGSSVGDCPLFDRGVVGGRDQRVLVQPGQAAHVVEPVRILDLDPGLGVTEGPHVHHHVHAARGKVLVVWGPGQADDLGVVSIEDVVLLGAD